MTYQNIVLIMAMEDEALPLIRRLKLTAIEPYIFKGTVNQAIIHLVQNVPSKRYPVARVCTVPAAISAVQAVLRFKPDLLISIGTAGALSAVCAELGEIFFTREYVMYHDRYIPLGEDYQNYGVGFFPCIDGKSLATALGFKSAIISSGNSLVASQRERETFLKYGASIEDMECAAVAEVAEYYATDFLGIKGISNFLDKPNDPVAEFAENLSLTAERLAAAVERTLASLLTH